MTGPDHALSNQQQQQWWQCGLGKLKHIFLAILIISFVSILFMRVTVKVPITVKIHKSKPAMLAMNQTQLYRLAKGHVKVDAPESGGDTEPTKLVVMEQTAILSTEMPHRNTVPPLQKIKSITPYLTGTVGEVSVNLTAIYRFLYGNKPQQQSIKSEAECPPIPPGLVGDIRVFMDYFPMNELNSLGFRMTAGSYAPSTCKPPQRLAIVIPFRNRDRHLSIFLLNLHPLLQKQQLSYTIFVINQVQGSKFNRALLMNIGFSEALKHEAYDCFIFHDVDLIPQSDKNLYTCPEDNPRHMSAYIDKFQYRLPYVNILGGIVAINTKLFIKVNGFSNQFFGWGGEDDDFSARCRRKGLKITRYPKSVARYKMISHNKDTGNEPNPQRFQMLKHTGERQSTDGLNTLVYDVKSSHELPLYTHIDVVVNQREVMNADVHTLPDYILKFSPGSPP